MMARVMLQKSNLITWPLGFQKLLDQFTTQWGGVFFPRPLF